MVEKRPGAIEHTPGTGEFRANQVGIHSIIAVSRTDPSKTKTLTVTVT